MRIGIDISQLAHEGTGVANYLQHLVLDLIEVDKENQYVLFFSSLRSNIKDHPFDRLRTRISKIKKINSKVQIKIFRIPPTILDLLWNRFHIFPIEWFIGDVDVFITSDWTEPPTRKARKATILYDLIVYKYPEETDKKIVQVQKRKLKWVKKESNMIFCISEATKKDARDILGIEEERLKVLYPGA